MLQDGSSCPRCRAALAGLPTDRPAHCPSCGEALVPAGWFYAEQKRKVGPVPPEELARLAAAGRLTPTDMVLPQGGRQWVRASSVPGLFSAPADVTTVTAAPPAPTTEATPTTEPEARAAVPGAPALPGYEILDELGRGGMGVVYRARQVRAKRLVALKMILAGPHATGPQLTRFRAEAEAVARLQHPNIVQVFEVGEHAGLPFFSLEFVEGGTLAGKLGGTPLPPSEAADLVEALARAMAAAHRAGVVHRDLKPANILLSFSRERPASARPEALAGRSRLNEAVPKITDFGLAKQLDDDSAQTREGAVMGTPSYMAPEQAAGDVRAVGPPCDVYALGAVLYECLTGRPPFRGASVLDTLEQVRHSEPVPPSHLQPKVPRDLETICLKCLQKEPHRRYASAEALADDLHRFRQNEPIRARPVGLGERAAKWARRHPAVSALAALVVLVTAAGVTGIAWKWREAVDAREGEAVKKGEAEDEARKARKAEEDARKAQADAEEAGRQLRDKNEQLERRGYAQSVAAAARAVAAGEVAVAEEHLRDCAPARRGWEWYYLRRLCDASLLTLHGAGSVAYVAGGRRLAAPFARSVYVWDAETGQEVGALPTPDDTCARLVVSPDGRRAATLHPTAEPGKRVALWDLTAAKVVRHLAGLRSPVNATAFSPDGKRLATAGGVADKTGELKVWDVADGRVVLDVPGLSREVRAVCFSPDGRHLAAAGWDPVVRVWDAASGKEVRTFVGHERQVAAVAFSPDGKWLASGGDDRTVRVWDTEGGRPQVRRGHGGEVTALAFSPDGSRLASGGWDRAVKLWEIGRDEVLTYRGHDSPVTGLAFNADGSRLASADAQKQVKVWDVTTPPGARPAPIPQTVFSVAFSPDGNRLATGEGDGAVRVWDCATGRLVMDVKPPPNRLDAGTVVAGLAFRAGGGELAAGNRDGKLIVWDVATGRPVRAHAFPSGVRNVCYSPDGSRLAVRTEDGRVRLLEAGGDREVFARASDVLASGLAFSPDGRRLAVASGEDRRDSVCVMDAATGETLVTLRGHYGSVLDLAWHGGRLATISNDGTVKVWDAATGRDDLTLRLQQSSAWAALAFSPDGTRLVSLTTKELRVWDPVEGRELMALPAPRAGLPALAFSPDGRAVAANGLDVPFVLDGGRGPRALSLRGRQETGGAPIVACSPDGRLLAGGLLRVSLWDAATGEERASLPVPDGPLSGLTFSPDGRALAASTVGAPGEAGSGSVVVWDVAGRQEVRRFKGHAGPVAGVAFSPDGRRVASASYDRTIKVWDAHTGEVALTLTGHEAPALSAVFSPDGKRLASRGADRRVRVWDAADGRPLFASRQAPARSNFGDIAFTPDGRHLVAAAAGVTVWEAETGREVRTLTGGAGRFSALAVSRDGKLLAAAGDDLVLWDFESGRVLLTYPTEWALPGGLAFTPDGSRLLVGQNEVLDVWEVGPDWQAAEAARTRDQLERVRLWQRAAAEQAEARHEWFAARFHRSRLIVREPAVGIHYVRRADANAELSRWDEAAADSARAVALAPDDVAVWARQALLALRAGDAVGYRKTCADLLDRHGETKDRGAAMQVARTCTRGAGADAGRAVRLAEGAVGGEARPEWIGTLGAALYRAGRHEEAATRLREAIKQQGKGGSAVDWLFLAMAQYRLGQRDEARRSLDRAASGKGDPPAGADWLVRLERDLLRAEAERVLAGKEP